MRRAEWNDKNKVIDIIVTTFIDNPGVNRMFKKGSKRKKCLSGLAGYAFVKALNSHGAILSSNEKGVLLFYNANNRKFKFGEFLYQLYFALTSIDLRRLLKVMKRESVRKSFRPSSGNYLYCWFMGVLPGGDGAAFELKNRLFEESAQQQIPIYLETSVERNQLIYERIGFKTYHEWIDEKEQIHFWFMKWDPPAPAAV